MTGSVGERLTVWVDLCHMPQYNFYRNTIARLSAEGHCVLVTVLDRGRLVKIVRSEIGALPGVQVYTVGRHGMTRRSAIWQANVIRNFKLLRWLLCRSECPIPEAAVTSRRSPGRRIDAGLSNGYAVAFFGWLFRFRTYSFDDDPQTIDYRPKLWFNTECNFCLVGREFVSRRLSSRAHVLPVLKEWAYLAPGYFAPSEAALSQYGLEPRSYIFLREVSVGTVNYVGQESGAVLGIADMLPKGVKVVLSLEEKSRRGLYPPDWILLQEPVGDIHSLMYYAAALVSSGDSMAREAALMGVPSYYLGVRCDMPANRAAAAVAGMCMRDRLGFSDWIEDVGSRAGMATRQAAVRAGLSERFIDVNSYIYEKILGLIL